MEHTLGKRITANRKRLGLTQDQLAEKLGITAQAVSKWENDLSCPDISLLPKLSKILGISVDELLSGKQESSVVFVPEENRKDIKDMMFRIVVNSSEGDKIRVNLPCAIVKIALDCGMEMPQISGNDSVNSALKNLDLAKIFEMVEKGVIGNLVEVESHEGDVISIFVE